MKDFVRRYGSLVLAVAVGVLLALLALRALRRISVVVTALIGAVLVAWLILGAPSSAPDRAQTSTSVEWKVVRACGREFVTPLAEDRTFVKRMELDCGIFGPKSSEDRRPYDGPY